MQELNLSQYIDVVAGTLGNDEERRQSRPFRALEALRVRAITEELAGRAMTESCGPELHDIADGYAYYLTLLNGRSSISSQSSRAPAAGIQDGTTSG